MKILTKLKKFFNEKLANELEALMDEHLKLFEEHVNLQKAYVELQEKVVSLYKERTTIYNQQTQVLNENTALLRNFLMQSGAKYEGNLVFEGWDGERFMIREDGTIKSTPSNGNELGMDDGLKEEVDKM